MVSEGYGVGVVAGAVDDLGGSPVVSRRVLVGFDVDGVGLARVDEEVLDDEGLDIVAVADGHVVALDFEAEGG